MNRHALVSIEAAAMRDVCTLATASEREALGLYCEHHGDTLVLACTSDTSVMLNHAIGFSAKDIGHLDEILAVYQAHHASRAFICIDDDDAAAVGALEQRGLGEGRAWRKFVRDASPATPAHTDLEVRRIGLEHGEHFGRIVSDAFDMPQAMSHVLARLTEQHGWTVFMSFDGNTPAGTGAMFVQGENAYLTFGATAPAFRSRGSQGATMAARIECARQLGVTAMSTETGEAVPGDSQHSWKNIERAGFHALYRIRNFALND